MNQHFVVSFPGIESRSRAFRHESITIYNTRPLIVPGDYEFTSEEEIAEPQLVLRQKPERVVSTVQLSEGFAGKGSCQADTGDIFLDMPLPADVGSGMFREKTTCCGDGNEVEGPEI